MNMDATEILDMLRNGDERVEIEAKRASEIDKSIMESVCAMANEPARGGGFILMGVERDDSMLFPEYEVVGVDDPDKIQSDFASQCRDRFNIPVTPEIVVEELNGKPVILAYVNEAEPQEKPICFKKTGLPSGAYRRIGSTDQHCTEEDIALFYQLRGHHSYDETVIEDVDPVQDFDPTAIDAYRSARKEMNPDAAELDWSDPELLHALCATSRKEGQTRGTLCGAIMFGNAVCLRRHFPLARVDYIRVPGREWVEDPENRFQTVDMRGPLVALIPKVVAQILDDIPKAFALDEGAVRRRDIPVIPQKVIRELVVNALVHRNYRMRQPVQIIRYSNRIEFRNPGHSLKPDDRLGEPGSIARNEKIAAIMHETGFAETKGSGIRVVRQLMKGANLTLPFFESDREADTFTATIFTHHLWDEDDIKWMGYFKEFNLSDDEAKALITLRELGALNNAVYRDINQIDSLRASGHLRRLRDCGILEQKGQASKTYYIPGPVFLESLMDEKGIEIPEEAMGLSGEQAALSTELEGLSEELDPLSIELEPLSIELSTLSAELPQEIREVLNDLGQRAAPPKMDAAMFMLCGWRPLTIEQIQFLMKRKHDAVRRSIRRLMATGRLDYLHPDNPTHPDQKYRALESEDE